MKVNGVLQSGSIQQAAKGDLRKKEDVPQKSSDKVEISSEARSMQVNKNLAGSAVNKLNDVPEVRQDRIADVKKKIEENYYETREIMEKVAETLMRNLRI
ncbi:flagellar biosynthesis anti-sigma factor FlgM [candidate division KSB1 bacterium]